MNSIEKKFVQSIIKPINDLQDRLIKPYAYSSAYSSISYDMGIIASHISHFPEHILSNNKARKFMEKLAVNNTQYQLIRDYCDTVKHRDLRNPDRIVNVRVLSQFEFCEGKGFRFMRTLPYLNRPSKGVADNKQYEFVKIAKEAVEILSDKLTLDPQLIGFLKPLSICTSEFSEYVALYHSGDSGEVSVEATSILIVSRNEMGEYIPIDPPEVKFRVLEE